MALAKSLGEALGRCRQEATRESLKAVKAFEEIGASEPGTSELKTSESGTI